VDELTLENEDRKQVALRQEVENYHQKAQEFIRHSKSDNIKRAYASDWHLFVEWCESFNFKPLPATEEVIAIYLTALAEKGLKASTIQRKIVAISQAHKAAKYESPTNGQNVHIVWQGIKREIGTAQMGKAPAVMKTLGA
jgi:site-specific recombinase XerD